MVNWPMAKVVCIFQEGHFSHTLSFFLFLHFVWKLSKNKFRGGASHYLKYIFLLGQNKVPYQKISFLGTPQVGEKQCTERGERKKRKLYKKLIINIL